MSVIDLATRRAWISDDVSGSFLALIADEFARQARDVADLACSVVEPFHDCENTLEQHLNAAFVSWQIEQVEATLAGKPYRSRALPIAIEATVQAFWDRLAELQDGFDPRGGDAA